VRILEACEVVLNYNVLWKWGLNNNNNIGTYDFCAWLKRQNAWYTKCLCNLHYIQKIFLKYVPILKIKIITNNIFKNANLNSILRKKQIWLLLNECKHYVIYQCDLLNRPIGNFEYLVQYIIYILYVFNIVNYILLDNNIMQKVENSCLKPKLIYAKCSCS